jgi:hypothetical protein
VGIVSAAALAFATSRYGIGMSSDSVSYIQGARHLADGSGYRASGQPVTLFAPGYSAVLSVGHWLGLDAERGARLLSIAALCGTIALSYVLLRRHVYSQSVIVAGTIGVAFSWVLLQVHQEAMSEHLFIVTVLLFVLAAEEHVRSPRKLWPLAALIALSWSAFYLRYAGIAFLGIAGLLVLVAGWTRGVRSALARSATVVVSGFIGPALWMKRNIGLGAPPLGNRRDAAATLGTNISRTLEELERWLTFDSIPLLLRPVALVAAIAALVATIALLYRAQTNIRREARDILPLALVVTVYVAYLVVTASLVAFAGIDFRFLSPVFAPSIILAAWVADRAYRTSGAPTVRRVIVAVGVTWLAVALFTFAEQVIDSHEKGAGGYASSGWQNSKLISDVREIDPTALTLSNDPPGIELFTGKVVRTAPQKYFFGSSESAAQLDAFVHSVECNRKVKLVWFVPNSRTHLYSIQELSQRVRLMPVSTQWDGVIYDVKPKLGNRKLNC